MNWKYTQQQDRNTIKNTFGPSCLVWSPVGSRMTSPVVSKNSDHDYLVLVKDENGPWMSKLRLDKPNEHYRIEDNDFNSWRGPGNRNFIVTFSSDFFRRFMKATKEAKLLELETKEERVKLFQEILYGIKT